MSTTTEIARVWPAPFVAAASDAELADWYSAGAAADAPWARVNFVSSLDGSATHAGRSGGLSDEADERVFEVLRRLCDVVVVGAGTVRIEGYGGMRVSEESERARVARGLAPQPVLAIVSGALDLDPDGGVFADAPVRPLVLTGRAAPADRVEALSAVADVLVCGSSDDVDTAWMLEALADRGLRRVHCEGGPHLFGRMIEDGAVDELCLTLSPRLEGGSGPRITADSHPAAPYGMGLAHVLASGDTLLLRYLRG